MRKTYRILFLLTVLIIYGINNSYIRDQGLWKSIYYFLFNEDSLGNKKTYKKIDLQGPWKFQIGNNVKWSSTEYMDEAWESIGVPSVWENEGFNGYNGYAWYRIQFDGSQLDDRQIHYLLLGFIDDVDEAFLNGTLIGRTGSFPPRYRTAYNSNRKYYIGNELINFEGMNTIAVKVYDYHGSGGIVKGQPGIYASEKNDMLLQNLYGIWKFNSMDDKSFHSIDYEDDHWESILVPGYWDNQGYKTLDGTVWYRKKFNLQFEIDETKTYYLVLGKIDDFDITYINGKVIGQTNDHLEINISKSYITLRVYEIPEDLLKRHNENVIAIQVEDIGKEGGIYSGPIGIIEQKDVTRMIRNNN